MHESKLGQQGFPVEEEAVKLVRSRDLLIDHYGEWPAFIDVEVIRITLERAPTDVAATHNLRAIFSTFDIHRVPGDPLRKQAHTEMLFIGVSDLQITEWAHQNPIQGLSLTRHHSERLNSTLFRVFWGGIGHVSRFDCEQITVVEVMDLNPFQKSLPPS